MRGSPGEADARVGVVRCPLRMIDDLGGGQEPRHLTTDWTATPSAHRRVMRWPGGNLYLGSAIYRSMFWYVRWVGSVVTLITSTTSILSATGTKRRSVLTDKAVTSASSSRRQ